MFVASHIFVCQRYFRAELPQNWIIFSENWKNSVCDGISNLTFMFISCFRGEKIHPYHFRASKQTFFLSMFFFGSNGGLSAISGCPQPSESCDEWSCTLHSSSCHSPSRKHRKHGIQSHVVFCSKKQQHGSRKIKTL